MRALTYHGAGDVRFDTVPDPVIEQADDIVLRVTATAICGSDLHLYHGKVPAVETGDILPTAWHIEAGRLNPEAIVTHRLALEDAVRGYEMFDEQQERCRKVILVPGAAPDA